jgi:hypothetical protein
MEIFFFMMITRGVKTRPSVFFSVRPFHVVVFSPFFFSPYFLLLLYTFSSSSSSWGWWRKRETPVQVMNQQSGRVPPVGVKRDRWNKLCWRFFFCYSARVLFIVSLFYSILYVYTNIYVSSTHICAGCKVLERFPSRIHILSSLLSFDLSVCLKGYRKAVGPTRRIII